MAVWQNKFINVNKYARSGKKLRAVKKIVMHYTANAGASAENHYRYFCGLDDRYASAHFFIDSKDSLCIIPLNELAYHANDVQKRVNGAPYRGVSALKPNANELSIGIELCIEKDGSFHPETIKKAIAVTAELCRRYDLNPDVDIVRHYDVTAKNCPAPWVKSVAGFEAFKASVKATLKGGKYVAPVEDTTPVIGKGDKGAYVEKLQKLLNLKGNYKLVADGIFGAGTETAVKDYQKKNGLTVDGVVGDATWAKLNYVAPKPAPAPVKPPVQVEDEDVFYRVVVGSFKDRASAEEQEEKLKDKKVDTFLMTFEKDKTIFYRVVAGSYKERSNADDAVKNLAKLGFEAFLVAFEK